MKILIVDDDALVAKTLARLLRAHDVQVWGEAINALEPICSGEHDVVFCDLMMPGLSGQDLFAMVTERNPALATRFVFITGGAFTEEASDFLTLAAPRVLHKPFNRQRLQEVLDLMASGSA